MCHNVCWVKTQQLYIHWRFLCSRGGTGRSTHLGSLTPTRLPRPLYPCWYTKNYICHIFHLIGVIYVQKACWGTDVWGRKQGQQPKGDPVTRRECCRAKGRSPRAPIRSTRRWGRYEYGWSTPILDLVWSILYDLDGRTCNTILHNSLIVLETPSHLATCEYYLLSILGRN